MNLYLATNGPRSSPGCSWQIGKRVSTFDKFAQARFDSRASEKVAKDIDFAAKFLVGNWLDETLRCYGRVAVEFPDLRGGCASDAQNVAFRCHLADQADRLSLRRVDASAGEEQIANERVAEITLEAWNPAESGDQPKSKLGKTKARQLIGDDQITRERELESASKCDAVDRGDRRERCFVERVHDAMNAFEKVAYPNEPGRRSERLRLAVEFAQVGAGAEAFLARA